MGYACHLGQKLPIMYLICHLKYNQFLGYQQADIINPLVKCYKEAKSAMHLSNEEKGTCSNMDVLCNPMDRGLVLKSLEAK